MGAHDRAMKRLAFLLIFGFLAIWSGVARAEERRYALVIGYNGAPAAGGAEVHAPLRFADDDALAIYEWLKEYGAEARLLTSPDTDSRRRYPDSADDAQAPLLAAVDRAMDEIEPQVRADAREGRTSVFLFFYSGHGGPGANGQSGLEMLDGSLSQRMLYERVLDRAPADVVHLFVDACHAESVVGSRDAAAQLVPLTDRDIAAYLAETTLARYPRAG